MKRTGMLGMFDLKFVKDRRMVQISGKILIASSNAIDGVMNNHATVRSEKPRSRFASPPGGAAATRSPTDSRPLLALISISGRRPQGPLRQRRGPAQVCG